MWARQLEGANKSYQILTIGESTHINDNRFLIPKSAVNNVSNQIDFDPILFVLVTDRAIFLGILYSAFWNNRLIHCLLPIGTKNVHCYNKTSCSVL